ncbi:unnamed protein product [Adineta ricciae]|uniref:G-protein coupled receptors family 1 profile domain-containing protein n=1 Tax=Adineta ricciae TaxID=249248 RepID=A0A815VTA1_ADIRI|nr:unnamed protein product [Adineta ricciae]CAF1532227.1 unnamed protein product [Adineta ricciae]
MSSLINVLDKISEQINIILGIAFFVLGMIGNFCNILVFSPILKTKLFPSSPSRLYILIGSIADFIYVLYLLSTRILISAFFIPVTNTSPFMCKTRFYIGQVCTYASLYTTCFATIDQYCLTSRSVKIRQLSRLSLARKILYPLIIFWILINIPELFLYDVYPTANGKSTVCTVYSPIWDFYFTYIQSLILHCIIPLVLLIVFGLLIKHNLSTVRQLHPSIIRQMTRMILFQALAMAISLFVITTNTIYQQVTQNISRDSLRSSQENLFYTIARLFSFVNYMVSFYIYLYSSKSLRKNFKNVLLNRPIDSTTHTTGHQPIVQTRMDQVRPTALDYNQQ